MGSSVYGSIRNQVSSTPLLGFWPVNSNYQGTIEYTNQESEFFPMSKSNISTIKLWLTIGNRTTYHDGTNTTNYLPLNGEAFQVGLKFYKVVPDEERRLDALGNSVTQSVDHQTGNVYNPQAGQKRQMLSATPQYSAKRMR